MWSPKVKAKERHRANLKFDFVSPLEGLQEYLHLIRTKQWRLILDYYLHLQIEDEDEGPYLKANLLDRKADTFGDAERSKSTICMPP